MCWSLRGKINSKCESFPQIYMVLDGLHRPPTRRFFTVILYMFGLEEIPQQEISLCFTKEFKSALRASNLVKHSNIDSLVNLTNQPHSHCKLNLSFIWLGWQVEKTSGKTSTPENLICVISAHIQSKKKKKKQELSLHIL